MAAGRVITGFSKPYAAIYTNSGNGLVTYSNVRRLARGVEVSLEPESADDNKFYADNVVAESAGGVFTGGQVTLTVDGLFNDVRSLFFGLPQAGTDGWIADGDDTKAPYIGIGYIVRYMSEGVTTYVPTVLTKAKFSTLGEEAATQEDEIDWKTTELTATLMRDDTAKHNWRFIGQAFTTEQEAENALITKLGGTVYPFNSPAVVAENGSVSMFGTLVEDMQSNVIVANGAITGTLKKLTSGDLVDTWGEGYFIGLKFVGFDENVTSVKVGLDPSQSSGLVEIIADPDKNGAFKITDKDTQVFKVVTTDGTITKTDTYDLSSLVMEA